MSYHHIDHYHCWQQNNPPCGQKIKHYKCCLCELPNPDIEAEMQRAREEILQYIETRFEDKEMTAIIRKELNISHTKTDK